LDKRRRKGLDTVASESPQRLEELREQFLVAL
jgi:hypothetical protein